MLAERDGKIIAGTFNVRDDTAMYGRYWGAFGTSLFSTSMFAITPPSSTRIDRA